MDCLGCPALDEPPEARQQVLCDSPRARTVAPSDSVWETRQSDVAHQAVAPHNYPSSGVDRRVPRLSRKEIRWNDCRPRPSARHLCLPFCNASIFAKPGHGRRSRFLVPSLILLFVLLSQDQRQAVLAVSDHDDLRIHAFGQVLGSLYSLPLEKSRADALSHDLLEIANTSRFDPFAFCLLLFFLQPEVHGKRFLLRLLLGFNRCFERGGQLNVPQQDALYKDAARPEQI